jgi:hypothetical protein
MIEELKKENKRLRAKIKELKEMLKWIHLK